MSLSAVMPQSAFAETTGMEASLYSIDDSAGSMCACGESGCGAAKDEKGSGSCR